MTKDVFVSVSGLQYAMDDSNPVEVLSPGTYYLRDGKKYIRYEEFIDPADAAAETVSPEWKVSNTIKIDGDKIDLIKRGAVEVQMSFEPGQKYVTYYNTPFGKLLLGLHTSSVEVVEEEGYLGVQIDYSLDINYAHTSDCRIQIDVRPKNRWKVEE